MKFFLSIFFYLSANLVSATSKEFTVTLKLSNNVEQWVYFLQYDGDHIKKDSLKAIEIQETIIYYGKAQEESRLVITFPKKGSQLHIFVYEECPILFIDLDKSKAIGPMFRNVVIENAPILKRYFEVEKISQQMGKKFRELKKQCDSLQALNEKLYIQTLQKTKSIQDSVCKYIYNASLNAENAWLAQEFLISLDVFVGLYEIEYKNELLQLCSVLENKFQNINLQNTINSIKRPKILEEIKNKMAGQKFIPIILPNTKGDSVTLSTQNKKYVLIEFWASWCAPCRAETPKILKLYQKYNDKGFDIYAISLDKDLENWKKAIKEDATFQWQHVVEMLPYTKSKILQAYKVEFVPTNFLIDTEGNIIATDLNGKTLGEKLEELFGKK